jgi:hypothetical protein
MSPIERRAGASGPQAILGSGPRAPRDHHPFRLPYIGLGLLDEATIRREGDTWRAEYRDGDDPFVEVEIAPDGRTTVTAREPDGRRLGSASGLNLVQAIGAIGGPLLRGDVSPFWLRVARRADGVWVALSGDRIELSFVPALGIGTISVPVRRGCEWHEPGPGPIARRIGLATSDREVDVVEATLLRWFVGLDEPDEEPILVHRYSVPGILVGELADAIFEANGPLRSIEWRPYLHHDLARTAWGGGDLWTVPEGRREFRFGLRRFAIVAGARQGVDRPSAGP